MHRTNRNEEDENDENLFPQFIPRWDSLSQSSSQNSIEKWQHQATFRVIAMRIKSEMKVSKENNVNKQFEGFLFSFKKSFHVTLKQQNE